MSYLSDDPGRDFDRWDMEQERRRVRLPVCERCGDHIQSETLWNINGMLYCPECASIEFEEDIELHMDED